MGSLSPPILPLKRDQTLLKSFSPRNDNNKNLQKPRSRFMILKKIDYLQWISALAVFIFFMFLFQLFLPLSMVDNKNDGDFLKQRNNDFVDDDFMNFIQEINNLDFGEDVKFMPTKLMIKFQIEKNANVTFSGSRTLTRFGNRKPLLALVFADLLVDPQQVLMVTVAVALKEIGYEFEVYSLENGPVDSIWKTIGVPVRILDANNKTGITIDWLKYDGVLVNSLATKDVISSLLQEPFKCVPLIWTIPEKTLATRASKYVSNSQIDLVNDWKTIFNRATVAVFPNYALPMFYATFDSGSYFVVPGSPSGACGIDNLNIINDVDLRVKMTIEVTDFVVGIVGSEFLYKGIWLEHAFVLKALLPLLAKFPVGSSLSPKLKIVILSQDLTLRKLLQILIIQGIL